MILKKIILFLLIALSTTTCIFPGDGAPEGLRPLLRPRRAFLYDSDSDSDSDSDDFDNEDYLLELDVDKLAKCAEDCFSPHAIKRLEETLGTKEHQAINPFATDLSGSYLACEPVFRWIPNDCQYYGDIGIDAAYEDLFTRASPSWMFRAASSASCSDRSDSVCGVEGPAKFGPDDEDGKPPYKKIDERLYSPIVHITVLSEPKYFRRCDQENQAQKYGLTRCKIDGLATEVAQAFVLISRGNEDWRKNIVPHLKMLQKLYPEDPGNHVNDDTFPQAFGERKVMQIKGEDGATEYVQCSLAHLAAYFQLKDVRKWLTDTYSPLEDMLGYMRKCDEENISKYFSELSSRRPRAGHLFFTPIEVCPHPDDKDNDDDDE